ncbi:MAG: CatB-related O-acetyltransferase [Patulibacter sp.]|nr:CatB-related O-acetyltransferase [Patulibacter sp.]
MRFRVDSTALRKLVVRVKTVLGPVKRRLVTPRRHSTEWLIDRGLLVMGRHSYSVPTVHYYAGDTARVVIGDWTSLARDVEVLPGGNHHVDTVSTFPFRQILRLPDVHIERAPNKGDVTIGSDVWVGRGARIMGGVSIGHGAVVAAYSTVTKDVPPYMIVGGSPARVIRPRFDPVTTAALLRIAWWEWSTAEIQDRVSDLGGRDIDRFIAHYDPERKRDGPSPG